MDSAYAEQVSAAGQALIQNYVHLFSATFLYWDYLLTLPDEFRYFWKRPAGTIVVTVLFFLNRYISVLGNIAVTISLFFSHLTESKIFSSLYPLRYAEQAAAWEALLLYDLMLFVMTLLKAYKTRRELRSLRMSLVKIVIHDGSWYFGAMAFVNAVS
ncbi:hypothetical protein GYMLUDRAFT_252017 [Collybiopsis luxurians FD-317 M1]|uniref:DUF6533 domain-containing protein n=1 Tax=Collybiopsis luxurians FD-317 M1 TaxID=944289 RepID=A0A0D0AMR4_9AGAR|nr:hypothetical protein GYMLUDRAFT_252017 [Collybiopsis luxurians FD-317 M1]